MKKNLAISAFIALSIVTKLSYSQNLADEQQLKSKNNFEITGLSQDSTAISPAKIRLNIYQLYSFAGFSMNSSEKNLELAHNQKFEYRSQLPNPVSFLNISYKNNRNFSNFFKWGNVYMIKAHDQLNVKFYNDSMWFSGRGAEKMNIQARLYKISERYISSASMSLSKFKAIRDTAFKKQIEYLSKNKDKIDHELYSYLYYQCYGFKAGRLLDLISYLKNYNNKQYSSEASEIINYLEKEDLTILKDEAHLSPFYMDYLYKRIKFQYSLENPSKLTLNRPGSDSLLKIITKKYVGAIRDRLLLIAFTDLPKTYINVFTKNMQYSKLSNNSEYKELLQKMDNAVTEEKKGYNFSLTDSAGNIIKLEHFKKDVVLMDFWFTGCIPCKILAKQMAPVIERFKNQKVIFITVNVDPSKKMWIKSINSGEYTHSGNINLYTNGLKKSHPLLKHYNISSFPRLILIGKNNTIISVTPARPLDSNGVSKLIMQINSGL